jgi:hypothetical protein
MAEVGLDLSREFPARSPVTQVQAADVVITMGCGDACPIRDDITRRVRDLISELGLR